NSGAKSTGVVGIILEEVVEGVSYVPLFLGISPLRRD
ncbi:hypothetical protein A2U01_0087755, partial [Trifolium medium]|nr:hypothetical protein [Trifolium medium]